MSIVAATVTPGYVFVKDAQGRALLTPTRLNLLGNPVVNVNLAGSIAPADLGASVGNALLTAVATVGAENTNVVSVTVQLANLNGALVSAVGLVEAWLSNTAGDGPNVTTFPAGGVAPVAASGVELVANADNVIGRYLTNSSGLLVLNYTHAAGALSGLYFCCIIAGKLVQGDVALSWA